MWDGNKQETTTQVREHENDFSNLEGQREIGPMGGKASPKTPQARVGKRSCGGRIPEVGEKKYNQTGRGKGDKKQRIRGVGLPTFGRNRE